MTLRLVQDERRPQSVEPPVGRLPSSVEELPERYQVLRDKGKRALEDGKLDVALSHFSSAIEVAESIGDQDKADLAFCNWVSTALFLREECSDTIKRLRGVLGRHGTPTTKDAAYLSCIAAYNLARVYELENDAKKGLFYARIALTRAQASGDSFWIAAAHNQVANGLLADSYFPKAVDAYKLALEEIPAGNDGIKAVILSNLGYALTVLGELPEAFKVLYQSLRMYRSSGHVIYEPWPHLDLCNAYLEAGKLKSARTHGGKALRLAEDLGDLNLIKLSLFLMGTVERESGEYEAAFGHFTQLQSYYPDVADLPATLMFIDVRQVVNLRA